jgi:hypothetical protein
MFMGSTLLLSPYKLIKIYFYLTYNLSVSIKNRADYLVDISTTMNENRHIVQRKDLRFYISIKFNKSSPINILKI